MWNNMTWFCPPAQSRTHGDHLHIVTGDQGDFWRKTFYGFTHDNGHALLAAAPAEFSAEVTFSARYSAQYDQAGLYLRGDDAHWIKAGVEHVNGMAHLACVVTVGQSDWSQMPLPDLKGDLSLRFTRVGDAVWVQYLAGQDWKMVRLAYFPPAMAVSVGPMACSPSRAGLEVDFHGFHLGAPASRKPY